MDRITGRTTVYALLGSPVGHSGSPAMYNYCFEKLGIDSIYEAFDVNLDTLETAIAGVKALGLRGLNITMPCKSAVCAYMDELSPAAELMGACNTAVNENGHWHGHNTDGVGFVNNLKAHGVDVNGKKMALFGAGGAGTAIAVQSALSGAQEITIFNICDSFFERAEQTAKRIMERIPACRVSVCDLTDEAALKEKISACDILANSTRAGMKPDDGDTPLKDSSLFRPGLVVADTVYNPRETRFLREAAVAGCTAVSGIGMLIRQGEEAFRLFTGGQMPVDEVEEKFFS